MSEKQLKTCPCCKGMAHHVVAERSDPPFHYRVRYAECMSCGLRTKEFPCDGYYGISITEEQVAEQWNRREGGEVLAIIRQLEERLNLMSQLREAAEGAVNQLETEIHQLQGERDAAVKDMECNWKCAICKNFTEPIDKCPHYRECGLAYVFWKWRGILEVENGKTV